MNKLFSFLKDSYNEIVNQVSWSKYSDLQNSAILVLVASLIFSLMIGVIDYGLDNVMEFIYKEF